MVLSRWDITKYENVAAKDMKNDVPKMRIVEILGEQE